VKIKFTKLAQRDLEYIEEYIFNDNPPAAKRVIWYIIERIETLLPANPAIGRPGSVLGTRELVITKYPYVVPYRVDNGELRILRVLHTSIKFPQKT
jgi:toxin ParE1/3/4